MIIQLMGITVIVFVGHSKERLVESLRIIRSYSIDKIILAVGEQKSSGERKSRQIAEELAKDLATLFDVTITQIDKKDIMRAAIQIVSLIRSEQKNGNDSIINISGSLRTFSIAAFISGCVTRSKLITAIPKYDANDNEIGIEDIIELPQLPFSDFKDEQIRILAAIGDGVAALDDLVVRLNRDVGKNSDRFANERSRISHHVRNFAEMGLVAKEKSGKNVGMRLTPLGEIITSSADGRVREE